MTKIRKNLFVILSVCLMISFGAFFATATSTAKAENSATVNVETVLMDEGASVRLVEPAGIRFRLFVNKDYFDGLTNPEVGMYIALADDTTETEMQNISTIPENAMFYRAEMFAEVDEDIMVFSAVIYDIPDTEYGTKLIANGYIKAENGTEQFATNPQTRSIAQTASIFLSQGVDDDALKTYVDGVVTEENFKLTNTAISTDVYKTAEPSIGVVAPEDLVVIYESSNENVVAVDENGNLTRGGALGTAEITATLGTTELTATVKVDEPAIIKINAENYANVYITGNASKFDDGTITADFGGAYTGNSTRLQAWNNTGFRVTNNYTVQELNAIAEDYTHVTLWIAADNVASGTLYLMGDGGSADNVNAFVSKAAKRNVGHNVDSIKIWNKYSITIADYISIINAAGWVQLFQSWGNGVTTVDGALTPYWFVSDIIFEKYPNITNKDMVATKVCEAEWKAAGITGDYTGCANRYSVYANSNYQYSNPYSADELEELKKTYSTVTLPFAVTFDSGAIWLTNGGFEGIADSSDNRYGTGYIATGKWNLITIDIEEYIALVAENNYEWFKPFVMTSWEVTNLVYYIGNLIFNK